MRESRLKFTDKERLDPVMGNDFFTHFRRGICIYIRKAKIGFYMRRKLPV